MHLNVDTNAVIKFTNKLEKLNKSAFPNAVRGALNSAAFDVKSRTLQKSTDKNFEKRQANFFKANSRVEMAKGNIVSEMVATVGMRDLSGTNYAVKDLEQQESGGVIGGKSFIPMDTARTGKSNKRLVQKKNRLRGIKNVVSAKKNSKPIVVAAVKVGVGGHVISNKNILFRVDSLARNRAGRIKLTPIYSYKRNRTVKVKATHFMREAAEESGSRIEKFYMIQANREFKKVFK